MRQLTLLILPVFFTLFAYKNGTEDNLIKSQKTGFTIKAPVGWTKTDTVLMGSRITILKSPQQVNDDFLENVNVISESAGNYNLDKYFEKNQASMSSALTDFKEISHSAKSMNGIKFKNIKYSHNYNGTAIDVDAYLTINNKKGYVITCSTSKGHLAKWQPVFDKIINSFSFK